MLDDLREWVSDNLRYILLGVAGILVLLIIFLAVRLITGNSSSKKAEPESQKITEAVVDETEAEVKSTSTNLVKDQQDVLDFVTSYYNARANKDYDTLATLCEVFDDTTESEMEKQDAAIESYDNIITYSKTGMTEGSYVVYVYFDAKVTGIDTEAPNLRELYLVTNEAGDLVITDKDSNAEQKAYIESMRTDADVQALIADVEKKLSDATAQDEELKNFVKSGTTSTDTQSGDDEDGTTSGEGSSAATGTMAATTTVNVRGEPSTDATLYGILTEGMEVEVLENLDSGWSHISYVTGGTTIEGYVMTQYLSAQ
jgi:flagellar basal body-associated protein FliL